MGGKRDSFIDRLREFKRTVEKRYDVERLLVFGSRATGNYDEESDVDVILVSKKFKGESVLKRPVGLRSFWNLDLPVDFLCYTPEEFEKLKGQVSIVSQALREGIEIT